MKTKEKMTETIMHWVGLIQQKCAYLAEYKTNPDDIDMEWLAEAERCITDAYCAMTKIYK